ncbi:hypothetical protein GCM10009745_50740 [Kribbella yunnanensis]|uniref:Exo-alpha-sialidase n=1 Tax=Kribbella yunnanensis TaxID=190194 RepID=A0ABN2I4L9_9ACTN
MSDLKDLAFTVQSAVDAPAFETLARKAVHRRNRRRVSVAAAISTVVAAILLVTTVNPHSNDAPITPEPTRTPAPTAPGSDKKGQAFAYDSTARLNSTVLTSPTRWAASWSHCPSQGAECEFTAVLGLHGRVAFAPVQSQMYMLLRSRDEPMLASPPTQGTTENWSDGALIRLTERGVVRTRLRHVAASQTFQDDEILTDEWGTISVINPKTSTMRDLTFPTEVDASLARGLTRDNTGRWWLLSGGIRSNILWSEDRGKTWQQAPLDPDHDAADLSVSPNGKTVVATSTVDESNPQALATMKVSTDAGKTWTVVTERPAESRGGPIAYDDGTVIMFGPAAGDTGVARYRITGNRSQQLGFGPGESAGLATTNQLTYALDLRGGQTRVGISSDRGGSWSYFEPR